MYDVFISYRRDGGYELARLLYERLLRAGMNPFFDVEELRSGPFNTKLYDVIENCKNIVLVLPKNGLERCVNSDDWVRLEIERAISCKKNIVPVMMKGFEWPKNMPETLRALPSFNGLEASQEYFDASVEKLIMLLKDINGSKSIHKDVDLRQVRSFTSCGLENTVFKIKKDSSGQAITVSANFKPTRLRGDIPEYAGVYYLFESSLDLKKKEKIQFSAYSPDESIVQLSVEIKPEGKKWMHESFDFELTSEQQVYEIDLNDFLFRKTRSCVEEITFVLSSISFANDDNLCGTFCIADIRIE